jgi:hypothetical protein
MADTATGMTVEQAQAELTAVNAAILRVLTAGQAGGRAGVSIQRAALAELRAQRASLISMISRSQDSGALIQTTCGPDFHGDGYQNEPGANTP